MSERLKIPRKTEEELRHLVKDILAGLVITAEQVPENLFESVFMPVGLGALSGFSKGDLRKIGTIYEHVREAGPVGINGFPMFVSCNLLHVDDWAIVKATLARERQRPTRIALEKPP